MKQNGLSMRELPKNAKFVLPPFAIVMKIGPHSGMSLNEIVESKYKEEAQYGVHYWGYSGTLCHPRRVLDFVSYVLSFKQGPPSLLLIETESNYTTSIGHINCFSKDSKNYEKFDGPIQLQGAQYAFVAQNLHRIDRDFQLDRYSVISGKNDGKPLSLHLRQRVNKAFVKRTPRAKTSHISHLAYMAQLSAPYVFWLKE